MVTAVRTQETREQMLRRLANKAREQGVSLRRDNSGRHFASSVSHPGTWHYVTAVSCDCIGFHRHQRCMHHAALLSAYGWIGDEPTPEPEPITCTSCKGQGTVSRLVGQSIIGGPAPQPPLTSTKKAGEHHHEHARLEGI